MGGSKAAGGKGKPGLSTGVPTATVADSDAAVGADASGTSSSSGKSSASGKSSSKPSTAASGASSSGATGGSGSTLTAAQLKPLLLTDKDDPGYTFDAARDETSTTDTPEKVTVGGAACQAFIDAQDALSTKYGTVAEADRQLDKKAENHVIRDSIAVMPSPDKAAAMIADVTAGLHACKSLTMADDSDQVQMAFDPIPQLIKDGQVGYVNTMTIGGNQLLAAVEVDQVGSTISEIALVGPMTTDTTTLQQMGATLAHLGQLQVQRIKAAQGQ
ncbi:sensor domain-containing protein [Catenulispora yoronensis]|uniref:sensor domain-containing protein n=1 Tax=Catenulispora yoronensis TaxID=450799 RepID=UPI0031D088BE